MNNTSCDRYVFVSNRGYNHGLFFLAKWSEKALSICSSEVDPSTKYKQRREAIRYLKSIFNVKLIRKREKAHYDYDLYKILGRKN